MYQDSSRTVVQSELEHSSQRSVSILEHLIYVHAASHYYMISCTLACMLALKRIFFDLMWYFFKRVIHYDPEIFPTGYQRHPLQHLGSLNMRDTTSCTAGNVFGSHEHLYQPHSSPQHHSALLPLHPGAPQCRGGLQLETRHSQLSHAQMQYDRTHPHSTAIEQPQLQSGLEFTDDELKELLDLRGQDL